MLLGLAKMTIVLPAKSEVRSGIRGQKRKEDRSFNTAEEDEAQWHTTVFQESKKQRQEDQEFKTSLSFIEIQNNL